MRPGGPVSFWVERWEHSLRVLGHSSLSKHLPGFLYTERKQHLAAAKGRVDGEKVASDWYSGGRMGRALAEQCSAG